MLVWLLRNRVQLGRLAILVTLFPLYLSTISLLTIPMAIAGIVLFITSNYWRIKRTWINFMNAHFWLKIQYFWFACGAFIVIWMVYINITLYVILPYLVTFLYLTVYIIWFNRINTKMTEEDSRIILKGETTSGQSLVHIEAYLLPIIFTLLVVFLIASGNSLAETRGSTIFSQSQMYWYFPIAVLILHFSIDIVFIGQIQWYPTDGTTTWKPVEIPLAFPKMGQPRQLATYFEGLSKVNQPPPGLDQYLEDNLHHLVTTAQDLRFLPFQIHYVRCMENWGREGRDHVHLLMAIILSSISQYRFIGLIPLYKRKMFYQTLQVVAMTGSMTQRWRELIEYEVDRKKDEHFVLDWVLGSRYLEFKYHPDWIVSWEGIIYKGKTGYYDAVRKIDELLQIRPQMSDWAIDLWNLCFEYVQVYIGEDSRQILSTSIKFYDQLCYLAQKKTTEEYYQDRLSYKEKLANPSNRLVSVADPNPKPELSDEEKLKVINSYLDSDSQTYTIPSLTESLQAFLKNQYQSLRSMKMSTIMTIVLVFILFALNLGGLILLDLVIGHQSGLFAVVVEIVILFFFSIGPSDADFRLDDQQSNQTQLLRTSTYGQSAINVTTASFSTATVYLLYGIVLLFSYRYVAI